MKSNPILEKKINASMTIDEFHPVYQLEYQEKEQMLSDFYDYLDKYYDLVDMQPGKEFLIKSFIEND